MIGILNVKSQFAWHYIIRISRLFFENKIKLIISILDQDCKRLIMLQALHFHNCNGLQLSKLRHLNSPKNHIRISSSKGVYISNLHIFAPEKSPNTDGIDISRSSNVSVLNTVMETGKLNFYY